MRIDLSKRLKALPPYLFVEIDKAVKDAIARGKDLIDLGIGDPDTPTPRYIIEAMNKALEDKANHRYALDQGLPELREQIAAWYKARFGVLLDPEREVLPLLGSKEGIAHIPLAFINPGDSALVPDPCYPPYRSGVIFAGGEIITMPLKEENGFLPAIDELKQKDAKRAKLIYLNSPNNPTSAVAEVDFFDGIVQFAQKNDLIVCHDGAYSEISYDGYRPKSFLEAEGAKEVGVEFHSLSKTFNMTGWRVGFVCGNRDVVAALAKVKANIDSGIFTAIQRAAIVALSSGDKHVREMQSLYQGRRDVLLNGLNKLGMHIPQPPKASFYVWVSVPKGSDSSSFAKRIIDEADLVVTPGIGFGKYGEGYIRIALTVDENRLKEAIDRLKKII
ncbi:MAG: LL-diaminopimelate aminotransferase [Candidatus Omnitrophica bacterium]|nr:LL-diaminopimelate aminotransferase [Candidatus Omnitrophota bacterium]